MPPILLASSSPYRAQLLAKLNLPFIQASPDLDESHLPNETPKDLVQRLSLAKAQALTKSYPEYFIIGSDQSLCAPSGEILGKPHTAENAIKQLSLLSGERVNFFTGLSLVSPNSFSEGVTTQTIVEPMTVHFKKLSMAEIKAYVAAEMPLDCAGSFKSEGLGISLFEKLEGDDPNSLIGLPLIQLCRLLNNVGINPLLMQKTNTTL